MFFGVHVLAIIIWQGMAHFRSGFETTRCHILPIFFIDISILYTHRTMYGIFTYLYHKNQPNVGKYTIHGWFGTYLYHINVPFCGIYRIHMHFISHSCCPSKVRNMLRKVLPSRFLLVWQQLVLPMFERPINLQAVNNIEVIF